MNHNIRINTTKDVSLTPRVESIKIVKNIYVEKYNITKMLFFLGKHNKFIIIENISASFVTEPENVPDEIAKNKSNILTL